MNRSLNTSESLHGHQEEEHSLSILDGYLTLSFRVSEVAEYNQNSYSEDNLLGELHSHIHRVSNFTDEGSSEE